MALTHSENPAPQVDGRCNALLWNCQGEIEGEKCDYHYVDAEATICPICNTPRRRCLRYPIRGRDACMYHGGKSLMGIDHPNYKGVGLSKHLPTRLLDTYFEAIENPDILNSTEDIAMLQSRTRELTGRLKTNLPPAEIWGNLADLFQTYRKYEHKARNSKTKQQKETALTGMRDTLNEIEDIIINGYFEKETWGEIVTLTEQIRKLRETERRRLKEAEQIITPSQFNTLLVYIINSIKTRIKNPDDRMAVMADIQSLRISRG